ncbi:MAG: class I SAM-dependent methyltransferase, partial [Planctomycetota bacterium]
AEEAKVYRRTLAEASWGAPRTLLELGSGGGNNASHLKAHLALTLVDLSPAMLEVSRALNPECEHFEGDMRSVRLDRLFDAVFVHDAASYLATEEDLRAAFATAYAHCRPGGAALFVPDYVRETFSPSTSHGGYDGGGRGLRYLEWATDPDPADSTYLVDYALLLREGDAVRVERDSHECGLFGRDEWIRWLFESGFRPRIVPAEHGEAAGLDLFVALRP